MHIIILPSFPFILALRSDYWCALSLNLSILLTFVRKQNQHNVNLNLKS